MARVGTFLIVVALIAGMVSCSQVTPPIQYDLTISSTEGGSVTSPGEGTFRYDEGTVVNLVAGAEEGYHFVNWSGDVNTIADVNAATTTIIMQGNYEITANFEAIPPSKYSLTIRSTTGGSVTSPGPGTFTYDKGTIVNLVATPTSGYQFVSWTGDVDAVANISAASTTITMNGGYSITANFAGAIRDWYDLDAVRDNMDGTYVLMNNLDSNTAGYAELAGPTANGGKGWQPIGSLLAGVPLDMGIVSPVGLFASDFDGQEHEIRDLVINRPDEDGVGLFGCIGEGAIENLGVVNAKVTGQFYVGGLVGWSIGTVTNSYLSGSVTGYGVVGGLVGRNEWRGRVSDSHSAGYVTGYRWVGGIVGGSSGTVSNSHSSGDVAGTENVAGLAGGNWGIVVGCNSTSSVSGRWTVGGLVGWNHQGAVTNCYFAGTVIGEGSVGGLVGGHRDGTVSNSHYNYDEVLISSRHMITIGALEDQDFEQWLANDKFLNVNERLSQEDGYYMINDVNDFKELLVFGQDSSLRFRLTNDLDLGGDSDFYIPYLAGEFEGNDHKIQNLRFGSDFVTQVGLFGYLASGGKVSRVAAEDVNIFAGGIVGGLVGENDGAVSDSYSSGRVAGWWCVGGLVGWIGMNGGTVSNSYYDYDEVLINGERIITIGALPNQDFDQWLANDKFLDVDEGLDQEDGYYLINDVSDFRQLLAFGQNDSLRFRLENDLDLATQYNFYIPYLAGEFDGDGHKISNARLRFDFVGQVGLFGYLASGGRVSELGVENVNIVVHGAQEVGGLVAGNDGTVSDSYSTGSVTGSSHVGGLVGWSIGTVTKSYSTSAVTGEWGVGGLVGLNYWGTVSDSYSTGSVSGQTRVGGLVGANVWTSTVSNSYSEGDVTGNSEVGGLVGDNGGTVNNSYSTGSVTGNSPTGGLVGQSGGTVGSSFWNTDTSGQAASARGTGKTTAEMKNIATFVGASWNITAVANPSTRNPSYIWNIVDGQTYPFLSWQP
jgi:hypothetical protein